MKVNFKETVAQLENCQTHILELNSQIREKEEDAIKIRTELNQ